MKTQVLFAAIILASAAVAGCTHVPDGTPREIALNVTTEMAKCDAYQHDVLAGSYDPGHKTIALHMSRGSVDILCSAPGYKDKRVSIVPDDSSLGFFGKLVPDFGPVNYYKGDYPASVQIAMERAPA
ncbi:MAG TPA: hypothetical protein VHT51_09460 [Micropepsaceae bacterium]|nr:hypothetical protein [Micropepsaceae bacterium]